MRFEGKEYILGDMILRYTADADGRVGMLLYPADCPITEEQRSKAALDPMVQVKLAGDEYQGCYAPGNTMRCGESAMQLLYDSQSVLSLEKGKVIETVLKDARGYEALHRVSWKEGERFVRVD